jgi:hypothetical protein
MPSGGCAQFEEDITQFSVLARWLVSTVLGKCLGALFTAGLGQYDSPEKELLELYVRVIYLTLSTTNPNPDLFRIFSLVISVVALFVLASHLSSRSPDQPI